MFARSQKTQGSLLTWAWQSNFRASESRSQACLDYAERSRKSQSKRTFKNISVDTPFRRTAGILP